MIATAVQADAQQDNAAFNAGVKAAQQDTQYLQGVQSGAGPTADEEKTLQALKDGPGGVQKPIFDNGILKRVYIVVKIPIPTSMKKATAKSFARNQSDLESKRMLVEWMATKVGTDAEGNVTQMTQEKGNDNGASSESGEDRSHRRMTKAQAEGQVRGITGLTEAVVDDEYIGIFGWSPNLTKSATTAQQLNNQGAPTSVPTGSENGGSAPSGPTGAAGRPIEPVKQKKGNASGINDF